MRTDRLCAVCAIILLAACAGVSPDSNASAGAEDSAIWCKLGPSPLVLQLAVHTYDRPDACGVVERERSLTRSGATHLGLHYSQFCKGGVCARSWPAPGTYPIGHSSTTDAGAAEAQGSFTARREHLDAACSGVPEEATGGSVTIMAVGDDVLDATYEIDFGSGTSRGTIHASTCLSACGLLQSSTCAGQ